MTRRSLRAAIGRRLRGFPASGGEFDLERRDFTAELGFPRLGPGFYHRLSAIPEATPAQRAAIDCAAQYSMTGAVRLWSVLQAVEHVIARAIPGAFVECGVWRGGNLILFEQVARALGRPPEIWGYDTFTGMTAPEPVDHVAWDESHKAERYVTGDAAERFVISKDTVRANLEREGCGAETRLIEGDVTETLDHPENLPDQIALLRLDTDWKKSTLKELEVLFPRLQTGGVLIVDDYGEWAGAREAVDAYFAGAKPWFFRVDYTCRLLINHPVMFGGEMRGAGA